MKPGGVVYAPTLLCVNSNHILPVIVIIDARLLTGNVGTVRMVDDARESSTHITDEDKYASFSCPS